MNALRVTFLTVMPSPYSLDLFTAIENDGRIALQVLYMEMAAPDTYWGNVPLPASATILDGGWRNLSGGRIHWNSGVIRLLKATRPDVVVVAGYSSLTTQVAMRWLRWSGIPWIFWGEMPGMRRLEGWRSRLRWLARYPAVAWPDAIAAIGTVAAREYRALAHQRCEIANIPYYTNLVPFFTQPRRPTKEFIRLLYCGQFIERKGVALLLDTFLALADELPRLRLQLIGDGPLKETLLFRIPQHLHARVDFAGFQPVEQLPHYFAAADIFVLPSKHDGWGVVVNQALGAGLPIICTDAVGAAHDLVTTDWNGDIVPVGDQLALTNAIRKLATDDSRRMQFGANSRDRALEWTPDRGAERWVQLAAAVEANHSHRGRKKTPATK